MSRTDRDRLVALAALIVLIVALPFFFVWSVNTLFLTEIPYTLKTWLASAFMIANLRIAKETRK
jgi:hypothetical protein